MFSRLGAHVIQADAIAHQLLQPGEQVFSEVVRVFGRGILNADGSVSRPKLAEAAFGSGQNSGRAEELNRIVHPAVIRKQEAWMESVGQQDERGVAMVEAALILEAGVAGRFDRLVVVTCQPEQRVQRWAQRWNIDADAARREVARRMAAQLPDADKVRAADYVIENSGSLDETEKQVRVVYAKLSEEASRRTNLPKKVYETEN
jgi:dephospho-CoA kinase